MIAVEHSDATRIIRFTRPELRNPLSVDVITRLHKLVDAADSDSFMKRLIFTGSGGSFASGADLREIGKLSEAAARDFAALGQSLMDKISGLVAGTIAAINGYCFGGALDLALACDLRIASPNAVFSHPGVGLGIITVWGGTQRLPRLIGEARALEMFYSAEQLPAAEALRIGLVNAISDDPLRAALETPRDSG